MEKMKSNSVSKETDTCMWLIEKASSFPQEKLGPLLDDLPTLP